MGGPVFAIVVYCDNKMSKGSGTSTGGGNAASINGGPKSTPGKIYDRAATGAAAYFGKNTDDQKSIKSYTGAGYMAVNELARGGITAYQEEHGKAKTLDALRTLNQMQGAVNRAIAAGQVYRGEVLRGQELSKADLARVLSTGSIVNRSLWSTTISRSVSKQFSSNVVFHIKQNIGVPLKSVSTFKHENEVLIPGGRAWKVTKSRVKGEVTHIWLKQR